MEQGTLQSIIDVILGSFVDQVIPILIGIAIILFAWGLFNYLRTGMGDKAELEGAKSLMLWGVIILFAMVSVWGLVAILQNIFFGDNVSTVAPSIKDYGLI